MTLKTKLLVLLGFVLLAVGAIGIFVPVLPTTPFVLAAAGCFTGSAKLSGWLEKSRFFGDYIKNYRERTGLRRRTVVVSLAYLWTALGVSAALIQKTWAYVLMPCIGAAVTAHILFMVRPGRKKGE